MSEKSRGRLFRKYAIVIVAIVSGALVLGGAIDIYFSYQQNIAALASIQQEKAAAAGMEIEAFIQSIERQIGWVIPPPGLVGTVSIEQRSVDYTRLIRQVSEITEVRYLDASGKECLRVSRLARNLLGCGANVSATPEFTIPRAGRIYHSPVYFRNESEPYMTLAISEGANAGVTVVEVNLKFVLEPISRTRIGEQGYAYIVDPNGNLVAHPDISLVLQKKDLSILPQVRAARTNPQTNLLERDNNTAQGSDLQGRAVLSTYRFIESLRWFVFVEQPLDEAFTPIYVSIARTILLLLAVIALAILASLALAHNLVTPINILRDSAARIGAGALDQRIDIHTGDELESLANEFNHMSARLSESYATLEHKVIERTQQLARSIERLQGLAQVSQTISSTLDLNQVLSNIVAHAVQLSGADGGAIYEFDDAMQELYLRATFQMSEELIAAIRSRKIDLTDPTLARAAATRAPVQISDVASESDFAFHEVYQRAGLRALLVVPLFHEDKLIGALAVRRKTTGEFQSETVDLLQTFAAQSALAIQNARLFQEIEKQKSELASWNQTLEERVQSQVAELERVGRLRLFLGPQVAELIASSKQEDLLASHRREIAAVFADMRNSTAFADSVEPEEVIEIMREYHAALSEKIVEHEGTVEHIAGDGAMVIFNDPVECDNPAERAVRMAIEMRAAIAALQTKWKKRGFDLGFGIGVSLGYATMGAFGSENFFHYGGIGSVLNVAARLSDEARDGQILVTQRVFAAIEDRCEAEPLGNLNLKGISQPVMGYNVLRVRDNLLVQA
ncbi:MAG: GAF domain-containing protein [Chloroflexi bacterium]|nr:GAF domain-containing protein [Chloroflexota bacterium]